MEARAVRTAWRWFLPGLLLSSAALKVFWALRFPGFLTGDDLEIVEAGTRCATGFPYTPGSNRSLVHPDLLACPSIALGSLLGLRGPDTWPFLSALPTVVFSTAAIALLQALARRLGWTEATARTAAFLYAFHWLPLAFGSTCYPRPISNALLLAGCLLLLASPPHRPGREAAAGALAAFAFAIRWSEGLLLIPLVAFGFSRSRRPRTVLAVLTGFACGALIFIGLFDAWTWGRPFASLLGFVAEARDPHLGGFEPRPWFWYGSMLLQWAGPLLVVLAAAGSRDSRVRVPLAFAGLAVVLLSFSPLKELRYVQIAIPFLSLAAALGWERLHRGARIRWLATAAILLAMPLGIERAHHLLARKSQSAVAAARFLAQSRPPLRLVALEQTWAYGDRLYLPDATEIRDLPPRHPLAGATAAVRGADAASVYTDDAGAEIREALRGAGLRRCAEFHLDSSRPVTVFLRMDRPCPSSTLEARRR